MNFANLLRLECKNEYGKCQAVDEIKVPNAHWREVAFWGHVYSVFQTYVFSLLQKLIIVDVLNTIEIKI